MAVERNSALKSEGLGEGLPWALAGLEPDGLSWRLRILGQHET